MLAQSVENGISDSDLISPPDISEMTYYMSIILLYIILYALSGTVNHIT